MQDTISSELQSKISTFLNRKARQFPDLHLGDRAFLSGQQDHQQKTWKYSRSHPFHGPQLVLGK